MIYIILFFEFFKIGFLSIGGGYATLPFLYHLSDTYHWYSHSELINMVSIASITPGPVGVNMATYCGLKTAGFFGSIVATWAIVLPAFFLVIFVQKMCEKFCENFYLKSILYAVKPAGCAMLSAVVLKLALTSLFSENAICIQSLNYFGLFLLSFFIVFTKRIGKRPLVFIFLSVIFGFIKTIFNF